MFVHMNKNIGDRVCPICKSEDVDAEFEDGDYNWQSESAWCNECNATFTLNYDIEQIFTYKTTEWTIESPDVTNVTNARW